METRCKERLKRKAKESVASSEIDSKQVEEEILAKITVEVRAQEEERKRNNHKEPNSKDTDTMRHLNP